MLFRTHLLFTLGLALFFASFFPASPFFFLGLFFGTLAPDLDHPTSRVGRRKSLRIMQWMMGHRTLFHSFLWWALFCIIFSFLFPLFSLGFFGGVSSHLFLDMVTRRGILPLYPLPFRVRGPFRTGGLFEQIFFLLLTFFCLFFFLARILLL